MSGAIDAQALGDLMDGDDGGFAVAIAQLERDLERQDDLTRRLRDQCRYQHLVLCEIYDASRHPAILERNGLDALNAKAKAAIAAANKSGLLA